MDVVIQIRIPSASRLFRSASRLRVPEIPDISRIQTAVPFAKFGIVVTKTTLIRRRGFIQISRPISPSAELVAVLVNMLRTPKGIKVCGMYIIYGLDGLLDYGMAGKDDVTITVAALTGIGKDVQLSRLGIDKLAP